MAEWPAVLRNALDDVQRGQVEPGGEITAVWANISGDPKAAIWIICPLCGTLGHCPRKGSAESQHAGRGWTITEGDAGLTMRPSILCNSTVGINAQGKTKRMDAPCGGHYWLTDGVLRET